MTATTSPGSVAEWELILDRGWKLVRGTWERWWRQHGRDEEGSEAVELRASRDQKAEAAAEVGRLARSDEQANGGFRSSASCRRSYPCSPRLGKAGEALAPA